MLSVNQARDKLLKLVDPINEFVEVPVQEVVGRVLHSSIISNIDSPLFSNSSMDGFAVISSNIKNASMDNPIELKVVGEVPAGYKENYKLQSGEAMRIMTGAPVPENANVVVPVESTNMNDRNHDAKLPDTVKIQTSFEVGAYIRQKGEDFQVGAELLKAGHRLTPQDIGILAMLGIDRINVVRKPVIGLLSSGDELLEIDEELGDGKIRETNSYTLSALISAAGGEVEFLGIAKDTEVDVKNHFDEAVKRGVDLIISSAGVSVGAYDYLRLVIEKHGTLDAWKVNMRPGKPLMFGGYKNIPIVGLPGNPVSSFVGFEVFVRPLLNKIGGDVEWKRLEFSAKLMEDVSSDGRESFLRAFLRSTESGELEAYFHSHQGSGNLYSLSLANGLIIVPPGVKLLHKDEFVKAWLL